MTTIIAALFLFQFGTGPIKGFAVTLAIGLLASLFTAVFFALGQLALGAYLGHSRFGTRYGAGGAVLILLLWVYYSALLLFFGAELTQVYANVRGHHVRPDADAWTIQESAVKKHAPPDVEGAEELTRPTGRREDGRTSSGPRRPAH